MTSMDEEISSKLDILAAARKETREEVLSRFELDKIKKSPPRFSPYIDQLRKLKPLETGVRDGMAYLKLPNGRVFYGYLSVRSHRHQYEYVQDLISPHITADTFILSHDIAVRYSTSLFDSISPVAPQKGGTIIECGAYIGHKAIRFIDEVIGETGKLLAVEMMPDNIEILQRNVDENNLSHCIDILPTGVWSQSGHLNVKGKGMQRNSLVPLQGLDIEQNITTEVKSLESIIREWGVSSVDLVYMTINGAEVEGLKGALHALDKIEKFFIAAPYTVKGIKNSDVCRKILTENNCRIIESGYETRIMAVTKNIK